jgi:hypothetical protein
MSRVVVNEGDGARTRALRRRPSRRGSPGSGHRLEAGGGYPCVLRGCTGEVLATDWRKRRPASGGMADLGHRLRGRHIVHECDDLQLALGLANDRNAGNVFIMDRRGLNPKTGKYELYDHLPPYWDAEILHVGSYQDFGIYPEAALRAAHRFGVSRGKVHAWPNFEQAWYSQGHVHGTFLMDADPNITVRDVLAADLAGSPPLGCRAARGPRADQRRAPRRTEHGRVHGVHLRADQGRFLVPDFAEQIHLFLIILPAISEVWMVLYLLVKGVKSSSMADRAPTAVPSAP